MIPATARNLKLFAAFFGMLIFGIYIYPMSVLGNDTVDVNNASKIELEKLERVGPATAEQIFNYRIEHGPFKNASELKNVSGIGPITLSRFRDQLVIPESISDSETGELQDIKEKININTASKAELKKLRGIGPVTAEMIVQYREEHGPFETISEITKVPGIGPATKERNKDKITVGPVELVKQRQAEHVETKESFQKTKLGQYFLERVQKYRKQANNSELDSEPIRLEFLNRFKQEEDDFFTFLREHISDLIGLKDYMNKLKTDRLEQRYEPEGNWEQGIDFYIKFSPPVVIYRFSFRRKPYENPQSLLRPAQIAYFKTDGVHKISFSSNRRLLQATPPYYHFQFDGNHGFYASSGPHGSGSFYHHSYFSIKNNKLVSVWDKHWMASPPAEVNEDKNHIKIRQLRRTPASGPWYKDYRKRCMLTFKMSNKVEKIDESCESIKNDGRTALHGAASRGDTETLEKFIDRVDVNSQDEQGRTPLHAAIFHNEKEVAVWLIDHGADSSIEDNEGQTPLDVAREKGTQGIIHEQ